MKPTTKLLLAAGVAIALSGCGNESDFERPVLEKTPVFVEVETCTGLNAYQPVVNYIANSDWAYGQNSAWYSNGVIYVNSMFADQVKLLKHEYVHHLLQVNYGDLDPGHNNSFFYQCT